jgi:Cu/Zn superoxide dismutase
MKRGAFVATLATLALLVSGTATAEEAFRAHLSGAEEVPPRDTKARGQATFLLSGDESTVAFRLIVSNIENVFAAHIHCGERGQNGPVEVTLFMGAPAGGRFDGVLATGSFATADHDCDGQPIVDAMRDGSTYVNVHTDDGVPPPNTGPGDFPGGEIRGQIS